MYIMCVCLFSTLSRMVGALQIYIMMMIIIIILWVFSQVISFGLRGKASAATSEPVRFRIHTPDSRIATKRAQWVVCG